MKNIFEILQQKEAQITRVRRELECLRIASALLGEPGDEIANVPSQPEVEKKLKWEGGFP